MKYTVLYSQKAEGQLDALPHDVARRIYNKINVYAASERPLRFATKLSEPFADQYRFRIGDYRAIFELIHGTIAIVLVVRVAHRRDVYE